MISPRQRRKLQIAYTKLVAHDNEYGADEYVDEAMNLISSVIGKRATRQADAWLEEEYAGSGMELGEE